MSNFVRVLKIIGRALWRGLCAVGRFFKFTGKRISKSNKTSRLNKRIAKKEREIERLYADIGRNYYEAHGDEPEELLSELCGNVGANLGFIDEAKEKIGGLQTAYEDARAAAKEKARARRASDKEKARAEKNAAAGIAGEPEEDMTDAPDRTDAPMAETPIPAEPAAPALVFQAPAAEVPEPEPPVIPPTDIPAEPEVPAAANPVLTVEPDAPMVPEGPIDVAGEPIEAPAPAEEAAAAVPGDEVPHVSAAPEEDPSEAAVPADE